ncbi:DUF1934 family protein [uncultured Dubosiella sp.]|uniref:DUF1934 family protein n=1 Tax=uncultured Dubosiella sp. TaxID=1937011 RepID=UPI00259628AD|nr:DUF1934 family protein [uncultured Dubosiella sp.]
MTPFIVLKDLTNDEVVYEGEGTIRTQGGLQVIEFGGKDGTFRYSFDDRHCEITSRQEVTVHLNVGLDPVSHGWIDTPYGRIDVETFTKKYEIQNNVVEVAYTLSLHGNEQLFHFKLEIQEKE